MLGITNDMPEIGRKAERRREKETETDRQTDRQTDRHTHKSRGALTRRRVSHATSVRPFLKKTATYVLYRTRDVFLFL